MDERLEDDPTIVILAEHYGCVADIIAERDRLRVVVDGLPALVERTVRALGQSVGRDLAADPDTIRDAVAAALAAIRAEERTVTPEELGNPDWYAYPEDVIVERDRLRVVAEAQREAIHARNCYITADTDTERDIASRAMDETRQRLLALDVSPTMGDQGPVGPWRSTEPTGAGSLEPAGTGSVDPISPTYDPDQYGGDAVRLAGTEEEFEFYRDPANQEPQGPPRRRQRHSPSVGDRAMCRWCHQPIIFTSSSDLSVAEDAWVHEGPQLGHGPTRQRACEPDMQSMLAEPDGAAAWRDPDTGVVHTDFNFNGEEEPIAASRCTSCGTIGAHQPYCPLYDPGDVP